MAATSTPGTHFRRDLYLLSATFVFVFMGAGAQQAYLVPYLSRVTDWSRLQCSSIVACVYGSMVVFRLLNLRLFPHWSDHRYTLVGAWAYFAFTVLMAVVAFLPSYPLALAAAEIGAPEVTTFTVAFAVLLVRTPSVTVTVKLRAVRLAAALALLKVMACSAAW